MGEVLEHRHLMDQAQDVRHVVLLGQTDHRRHRRRSVLGGRHWRLRRRVEDDETERCLKPQALL